MKDHNSWDLWFACDSQTLLVEYDEIHYDIGSFVKYVGTFGLLGGHYENKQVVLSKISIYFSIS